MHTIGKHFHKHPLHTKWGFGGVLGVLGTCDCLGDVSVNDMR